MKTKKHPKANLENYSKLFVQLGLVLTLVIIYVLIQSKTFDNNVALLNYSNLKTDDFSESLVEYKTEIPKIQTAPKKIIVDVIKKIDNSNDHLIETIINPADIETPIDISKIDNVKPIIDEGSDEVPFITIEDSPVFPGCKGTKDEMKACFTTQITKFVSKHFDANLAEELNLTSGIQRIFVAFKVDDKGNIVDVKARSPYKKLQDEAIRVVKLLPQMTPGKQRKKPVTVSYSLPIAFRID